MLSSQCAVDPVRFPLLSFSASASSVYCKLPEAVSGKLASFIADGPRALAVLSDFDYTISTFYSDPVLKIRGKSCHNIIEESYLFDEAMRLQAKALTAKYYPIEVDVSMAADEKARHMYDWTVASHKLISSCGISRANMNEAIKHAVDHGLVKLRSRFQDFVELSKCSSVPMMISSAGIADVLREVIRCSLPQGLPQFFDMSDSSADSASSIYISSNRCRFDTASDVLVGFEDPVVHLFNKRAETFKSQPSYFPSDLRDSRRNVLLIGDSPTDVYMAIGTGSGPDQCLTIGYLNDKVDERFGLYLDIYDIVVVGDRAGFEVPLEILQMVCRGSAHPRQ